MLCDAAAGSRTMALSGFGEALLMLVHGPFVHVHSLVVWSWLMWNTLTIRGFDSDHDAAAKPMLGLPSDAKSRIGGRTVGGITG